MTDPSNVRPFEDNQAKRIVKERRFQKQEKSGNPDVKSPTQLYEQGIRKLESKGYEVTLVDKKSICFHQILKPQFPQEIKGISYPHYFKPLQPIRELDTLKDIDMVFAECGPEVLKFWDPFINPTSKETPFDAYCKRILDLQRNKVKFEGEEVLDYKQTFDPDGTMEKHGKVYFPKIWVPATEWFDPAIRKVRFKDIFTIFPKAERELLMLILGRIGVGRTDHLPPNFKEPISHTARMAGVIVGKDAGLGKSTLFNGVVKAIEKCGFTFHTFKNLSDKFGVEDAAMADLAYKDDSAMKQLKSFLASEDTKTLVTNGWFQVEEKFERKREIKPRCMIIINSNDWDANFAYDLDPGIVDRIKILSTYRKYEVENLKSTIGGVSANSPDLRPHAHLSWLSKELGVSVDSLYLWALRLATNRFWEVINDKSDPSKNALEEEVRKWTTRCRIRFKNDVSLALINAMKQASAIRRGEDYYMKELTVEVLFEHLQDLYFVGVDPSGYKVMEAMKKQWEDEGRTASHYYQGFREIRWETLKDGIQACRNAINNGELSWSIKMKMVFDKITMRDGFRIGGGQSYLTEDWNTAKITFEEAKENAQLLLSDEGVSSWDIHRLTHPEDDSLKEPKDGWIFERDYTPELAEKFREVARDKMMSQEDNIPSF